MIWDCKPNLSTLSLSLPQLIRMHGHIGKGIKRKQLPKSRRKRRRKWIECTPLSSSLSSPYHSSWLSGMDYSDAMPTSLFFAHNEALVPPYRVIIDTNFINLSLENRIDLVKAMMDVLYAKGELSLSSPSHCLNPGTDWRGFVGSQRSLVSRIVFLRNSRNWDKSIDWHFGTSSVSFRHLTLADSGCEE